MLQKQVMLKFAVQINVSKINFKILSLELRF